MAAPRLALPLDWLLAAGSVAWVVAVLLVPPLRTSPAAAWVTGAWVVVNFLTSVWSLMAQKRILVLLNLVQIVLFTVLHSQVYDAFGAEHYQCHREPRWTDWVEFSVAHVLRAADLLDFFFTYGIELQNVHHASRTATALVVAMHLVVDLFLFALLVKAVTRLWGKMVRPRTGPTGPPRWWSHLSPAKFLAILKKVRHWSLSTFFLLILVAGYLDDRTKPFFQIHPQLPIWMMDNLIRTVDVLGLMQIFHWQLYDDFPLGFWTRTAGLVMRLGVGLYAAEWLVYLQLKLLGRRALRLVGDLVNDLGAENKALREAAEEALVAVGEEAVPDLLQALAAPEVDARRAAKEVLTRIDEEWRRGRHAREAVPALTAKLADPNANVAVGAALALLRIGADASAVIRILVKRLADAGVDVRLEAVKALRQTGADAAAVVPLLVERLADAKYDVRLEAVKILGRVGADAAAVVPALIERLADEAEWVRVAAADALGQLGPKARAAAPALIERLADADHHVQISAVDALGQIGADAADVPALVERLPNERWVVREAAARALGLLGPTARPAAPALIARLADPHSFVRSEAVKALVQIGADASAVVPALVERLADEEESVRAAAAEASGQVSPKALEAIAAAKKTFPDPTSE